MCGKKDRAFFDAPKKARKIEDYARLTYIALSCGFKKMAIKIMANIENNDEFQQYLDGFPKDAERVIKWFEGFVREVPDPQFRNVAAECWEKTREKINEDDFDIRSLLF